MLSSKQSRKTENPRSRLSLTPKMSAPTVVEILKKFFEQVDSIPSLAPIEADQLVAEVLTKDRLVADLALPLTWEDVEETAYDLKNLILGDEEVIETKPFPKDNPKSPFDCSDYLLKKEDRTYSIRSFRRGDFIISIDPPTEEGISCARLYAKESFMELHYQEGLVVTTDYYENHLKATSEGFTLEVIRTSDDDPIAKLEITTPSGGKVEVSDDRLVLKGAHGFECSSREAAKRLHQARLSAALALISP